MKTLHIIKYIDKALKKAEYNRDENGMVIARVPKISGFFSQGRNFEEARENLADVIEGNIVTALQLGFPIPEIDGVAIRRMKVKEKKVDYA